MDHKVLKEALTEVYTMDCIEYKVPKNIMTLKSMKKLKMTLQKKKHKGDEKSLGSK